MAENTLKVSYCTTCKGRLHHLMGDPNAPEGTLAHEGTLRHNLEAEKNNSNVEFVLLSYGRDPELDRFVRGFEKELETGRLRYVVYPAGGAFKVSHAKNMAHRLATGDILCNLDADNAIAPNTSDFLKKEFSKNNNIVIYPSTLTVRMEALKRGLRLRGIGGRVAIARDNFEALGGYNESYQGWGDDDREFLARAAKGGMEHVDLPGKLIGTSIEHTNEERIKNVAPEFKEESLQRAKRNKFQRVVNNVVYRIKKVEPFPNLDGNVGCGTVYVNFSAQPTHIAPLGEVKKPGFEMFSLQPGYAQQQKNWGAEVGRASDRERGWESPGG